jgi:hypothetical protein
MPSLETESTSMPAYRAALDSLRKRLLAVPEVEVQRGLALDAGSAGTLVEASVIKLEPHRAALVEQFADAADEALDDLPALARAARQADVEYLAAQSPRDLSPQHDELRAAYQMLLVDAESLAVRRLVDPAQLEAARDSRSYAALVRSTLVLVQVLRDAWPRFAKQTPLTRADLDRAERAAQRMAQALGDRDNRVSAAPAAELRTRALSELARVYEEVRRMVTFVRWHQDDADALAPSLWANRGRRGRGRGGAEDAAPGTPVVEPQAAE